MRWSVGMRARGDRVLTREEIVELADAVAPSGGVASGIGTDHYGARLVIEADGRDEAIALATRAFSRAASVAGLPAWPVCDVRAVSEDEDEGPGAPESSP